MFKAIECRSLSQGFLDFYVKLLYFQILEFNLFKNLTLKFLNGVVDLVFERINKLVKVQLLLVLLLRAIGLQEIFL